MADPIKTVQDGLDKTARALLRYISTNNLEPADYKTLAKFMFGCMNQKSTIAGRVEQHGSGELGKVLEFIGRASKALVRIEEKRLRKEADDVNQ
jgi:hypothetical protein